VFFSPARSAPVARPRIVDHERAAEPVALDQRRDHERGDPERGQSGALLVSQQR
jgi:hypothetical protein